MTDDLGARFASAGTMHTLASRLWSRAATRPPSTSVPRLSTTPRSRRFKCRGRGSTSPCPRAPSIGFRYGTSPRLFGRIAWLSYFRMSRSERAGREFSLPTRRHAVTRQRRLEARIRAKRGDRPSASPPSPRALYASALQLRSKLHHDSPLPCASRLRNCVRQRDFDSIHPSPRGNR